MSYMKWNFREMDVSGAFLKSDTLGALYAKPPLFAGGSPDTRWKLVRNLYGILRIEIP